MWHIVAWSINVGLSTTIMIVMSAGVHALLYAVDCNTPKVSSMISVSGV